MVLTTKTAKKLLLIEILFANFAIFAVKDHEPEPGSENMEA
jgi:hypothetical protein